MAAESESEVAGLSQGSPKRRKTELLLGGTRDRPVQGAVAPEHYMLYNSCFYYMQSILDNNN